MPKPPEFGKVSEALDDGESGGSDDPESLGPREFDGFDGDGLASPALGLVKKLLDGGATVDEAYCEGYASLKPSVKRRFGYSRKK